MITKQQLLDNIAQGAITDDLKQSLTQRIGLYPDTLEQKHIDDLDNLLQELEAGEITTIDALTGAADAIQNASDRVEIEYENAATLAAQQLEQQAERLNQVAALSSN